MGCVPTRVRERIRQVTLRKSEYIPLNPVFGVPLINVVCSEKFPYVAKIVVDCAEFIERDENIAQNVYSTTSRLPYDQKKVSQLREMIHMDGDYDAIKSQKIHVVAGLLQLFFRQLKPRILSSASFQRNFADSTDFQTEENQKELTKFVHRLDPESHDTLKYLMKHLHTVGKNSSSDTKEIATVWTPCIFASEPSLKYLPVVQVLISRYKEIFAD